MIALFRARASLFSAVSVVGILACSSDAPRPAGASAPSPNSGSAAATGPSHRAAPPVARMNDVSVLYPQAMNERDFANGYLPASAAGAAGTLLPRALYTSSVGSAATGIGAGSPLSYEQLRVVAFRWDPCFDQIGPVTDSASCQNQLRVILQAISFANGKMSAADGGVHLFYSVSRDQLIAGVNEVIALRRQNSSNSANDGDGPLAVHPVMALQGVGGGMARGLNAMILKYAGVGNLVRFTQFFETNTGFQWQFSGFNVNAGAATAMDIPTLPSGSNLVSLFAGFGPRLRGNLSPQTQSPDDLHLLVNVDDAAAASNDDVQGAYDSTYRIESPNLHSPDNIDCASCHAAAPVRTLVGNKLLHLSPTANAEVYAADPAYVPAADMAVTTPLVDEGALLNVHAFSYKDETPMINQRVINETANVVAYLNGQVLGK